MHLRRIEVRDFRKLNHVIVKDLENGLNVVVGDNEAGKSTLLAALRAALFERHRVGGEVAAAMQPYNQSVRPEIAIDFEIGGQPWSLRKAFCQRPEAELRGPGERYTGDEVEERLASLFGFTPPGKGGSQPDKHQGVYGLCWVEQGAAHRSLGVGAGRETIASALEREVGQMVGGERGRALLGAAEIRREAFWTKNAKPKGAYKALLEEISSLEDQKSKLKERLSGLEEKVSALAIKQDALARHAREDRLNKVIEAVAAARLAAAEAQVHETALHEATEIRKRCQSEREAAFERKRVRQNLIEKLEAARNAHAQAHTLAEEAKGALARHQVLVKSANDRLAASRSERLLASERASAIEQAIARRQAIEFLSKLQQQLSAAEAAEQKRRSAVAVAAAITITKERVAELERLQSELDRARVQLEAASVRISFEPDPGKTVTIDEAHHDPDVPLHLTHDAELVLGGFGRLSIRPGGGTKDLAEAVERAVHALEEGLRQVGVEGIAEAKALVQRKLDNQRDAELERKVVASIAPKGLDALRQEVESRKAEVAQQLPEAALAYVETATNALLEEARRLRSQAADAEQGCEAAMNEARAAQSTAAEDAATLIERSASTKREVESSVQELVLARNCVSDEHLEDQAETTENALARAVAAEANAKDVVAKTDPGVALALQRAERAEQSIRSDIERLTQERRDIEIELRTLGRDGLGEQLAEVEGQLALKVRQAQARELEATAARLLYDTLAEAQRESKDRWLGPVRERVKPYLKLIQPDTDIVLNEDTLEIEGFVRRGHSEPFTALSVGAREQVAVITRLALAEILRTSGRPSAVILDDALVNTDEGRLERMHLVLHKAAETLQVLVLTCRERDFIQLGAPIRRL